MKKSVNGTLILFGVFAILLGWYLIFEQKVRPERDKKQEDAKHLVQLDRESIQELEIERLKAPSAADKASPDASKYEVYRLKKTGADWNLVTPVDDEADSATMGTLLAAFTSTQSERTVDENPKDLAPFGLKEPILKVRARKDSSSPWTEVRVGGDTAVGFNSYVQMGDKPAVLTASRNLKASFDKDPSALRNKKLFKISRGDINSLEVQTPRETFVLAKGEGEDWLLARQGLPADAGEVNKTLNAIVEAKAKSFADDTGKQTAKFGLSKPAATAIVTVGREKKKVTLFLGRLSIPKMGDLYYVKDSEKAAIAEVEKELPERLLKPAADYRNLQIAKFNRFTVTKIRVEHKKEPVELVKKGNDWQVPGDTAFTVDGAQVDTFLTNLQDSKATDFIPMKTAQSDLKSPELVVRLFEKEGDKEVEKHTLTFGRRFNKIVASRTGLDLAMQIKVDDYMKLNLAKPDFAKKPEKKAEQKKPEDEKKPAGKTTGR